MAVEIADRFIDSITDRFSLLAKCPIVGLRDRALIALMTFTFARVGAAAGKMRVEDVYVQGRRTWVRLHEKGGKRHEMPCHHKLDADLHDRAGTRSGEGKPLSRSEKIRRKE